MGNKYLIILFSEDAGFRTLLYRLKVSNTYYINNYHISYIVILIAANLS